MQVPLKQYLHGCRRMDPWLPLPRILLFLDTFRPRDTIGSDGVAVVCSGFCARSWASCQKLHWFPFEYWPLFLSTGKSDHCSCFNFPVPGVKVSQSKFLIFTPLHHCLPFLIIGHRYLLMNLNVEKFQCGSELRGLAYSQFCTDFPRYHRTESFDTDSRTSSHPVSNS